MQTLTEALQQFMDPLTFDGPNSGFQRADREKLASLQALFAGQGLQDSFMVDVLQANNGQMEATVEALLEMTEREKFLSGLDQELLNTPKSTLREGGWVGVEKEEEEDVFSMMMRNLQPAKHHEMAKLDAIAGGAKEEPTWSSWAKDAVASWLDRSVLVEEDMNSSFMHSIKGLTNEFGENNCFLNVIIQSLYHLKAFRNNFNQQGEHTHEPGVTDRSCPLCALKMIFTNYQFGDQSALPPNALRDALHILYSKQSRFQRGQLNDAAEAHLEILQCLHNVVSGLPLNSEEENCKPVCFVHRVFCMNIVEYLKCDCGGQQGEAFPYKEFIHYVPADALRLEASKHLCLAENGSLTHNISFSEVISRVHHADVRICKNQACKHELPMQYALVNQPPEVITIGLVWTTPNPSGDFIYEILDMIAGQISLKEMFDSVIEDQAYRLRGMVCYYGKHYVAYFRDPVKKHWVVFDDMTVKRVSRRWEKVVEKCTAGKFQPSIVWYEKVSKKSKQIATSL